MMTRNEFFDYVKDNVKKFYFFTYTVKYYLPQAYVDA